jgi:glycosyltransferase involved in cell wall biosynthesis
MIVKNEASVLGACLDSLRGHVDEIVVVDGGSTDDGVAIAAGAGARVFVDLGDVSAARNRALRAARGEYCLMIDGDEVVRPETWAAFSDFVREARHPRGRIMQVSDTAEGIASVWITRVCVNDERFHYEGSIHEQLVGPDSVGNTGLAVLHSGYSPQSLARKGSSDRNLRLLRAELARHPRDPYLNYQLGKTLLVSKRADEALPSFAIALERVSPSASYASALACDFGYALKAAGRPADALAIVRRFQREFPDYTDLWFLEGLCHLAIGSTDQMVLAFERCLALGEAPRYATVQGVGTFRALYNLGLYHELRGDRGKARELYSLSLTHSPSFAPAVKRLESLGP